MMRHVTRILAAIVIASALLGCGSSSNSGVQPKETTYGSVNGYAFLKGTGITLSNVVVTVGDRQDTTLNRGKYRIDSIPDGAYLLTATREDYATFSDSVTVSGVTSKDIMMEIGIDAGDVSGIVSHPADERPVGGAVLTIGELSSISKPDGTYLLRNVPIGEHEFTCVHPSYHPFSGTVVVDGRSVNLDVALIITKIDTVTITDDATISWSTLSPLDAATNYGFDGYLSLEYRGASQDAGVRKRVLISLPPLPVGLDPDDLEIANLVLRESPISAVSGKASWVPETISIRRVLSPWVYSLVTWNTAPLVSDDELLVSESESRVMVIDIRYVYQDSVDPRYGLRLALECDEESSYRSGTVSIHSSQSQEQSFRPRVAFKYTF